MTALNDLLKLLKENQDPRKWDSLDRVWPELSIKLKALTPVDQVTVVDPTKSNVWVPTQQEVLLTPKEMTGGISFFANHNDPSTAGRAMAITLESADKPIDQWFLAARFRYVDWVSQGNGIIKPVNFSHIDQTARIAHKKFLATRRIKITNPANGKAIIVRCADVGPGIQKRVADVSETAIKALGAVTDDQIKMEWVNPLTQLGPVA